MKKFLKQSVMALLISSLVLSPVTQTWAADQPAVQVQSESAETADNSSGAKKEQLTGYAAVKASAEKKASIITSMYGAASVQYALIENGEIKISGQEGVYSKESKQKLTKDNMYGIGSISKMFATASVMQLVEAGKVELDTPVTDYIPDFKMADERYQKITVRMLLNHSSGLLGSSFNNATLFDDNSTYAKDNFLKNLETQRLKADPGAFSVYCNDGFTLAEILVERVSGRTFSEYISENISKPLGMSSTKTPQDTFDRNKLARTYMAGAEKATPVENFNIIGAGGIYSSAEDLCRFSNLFLSNSDKKFSPKTLSDMENKEYLRGLWSDEGDTSFAYGLGWDGVNDYPFNNYTIKALGKAGDTYAYHGSLLVLPGENMAAAVLSSGASSTADQMLAQDMLLNALKEKGRITEIQQDKTFTKPTATKVPEDLKQYEGVYLSMMGMYQVKFGEDRLLLSSAIETAVKPTEFVHTAGGRFVSADGSATFSFVKEKNGNIYLQSAEYTKIPGLGQFANIGYAAQKAEDNILTDDIAKVWKGRDKAEFFILNEKYNSEKYMLGILGTKLYLTNGVQGYLDMARIISKDKAESLLQIPGMSGRDLTDFKFYTKNKIEYMTAGDNIYIGTKGTKKLSTKSNFTCTIGKEGYAAWYTISDNAAGKTMTVKLPKKASFAVYDKNGKTINYSLVSKKNSAKLPKEGYVVFVGSPGAKFSVNVD